MWNFNHTDNHQWHKWWTRSLRLFIMAHIKFWTRLAQWLIDWSCLQIRPFTSPFMCPSCERVSRIKLESLLIYLGLDSERRRNQLQFCSDGWWTAATGLWPRSLHYGMAQRRRRRHGNYYMIWCRSTLPTHLRTSVVKRGWTWCKVMRMEAIQERQSYMSWEICRWAGRSNDIEGGWWCRDWTSLPRCKRLGQAQESLQLWGRAEGAEGGRTHIIIVVREKNVIVSLLEFVFG